MRWTPGMFGTRFDPNAADREEDGPRRVSLKRRMSHSDSEEEEEKSGKSSDESTDESEDSSDESEDSSDESEDSEESDSESNVEDAMDIDTKLGEPEPQESSASVQEEQSSVSEEPSRAQDEPVENDPDYVSKHQGIFQKFKKGVTIKEDLESEESDEEVEEMDLKPMPQPELPRDKRLVASSAQLRNLDWLTKPIYSSPSNTRPFSEFALSPFMLKNLANHKFTNAFSVQIEVMNLLLEDIRHQKLNPDMRGDLLVNAATGSGKTLAYSIPIIEDLSTRIVPRVRAIVLVPTKPLINQVKSTLSALSKGTTLSIVSLKSDVSIKEEGTKLLANEPDIIVATPGRLVEHLTNGSITLGSLRYLVIDEADRLLNQSFQNWCKILIAQLESTSSVDVSQKWTLTTKKLIFSATLTTDAGKLSALKFQEPRLIIVNDQKQLVNEIFTVPSTLAEFKLQFGTAKASIKPLILAKFLLAQNKLSNVLIFAKSNEASMRLARLLQLLLGEMAPNACVVEYINSTNNTTAVRSRILKDFSTQKVHIVVATDLIARGIDILSITDIINYDLPNSSREYVHRVGRAARANQDGRAYNMCFGKGETKWFRSIMKEVARPHEMVELGFDAGVTLDDEQVYEKCLGLLQKEVFTN